MEEKKTKTKSVGPKIKPVYMIIVAVVVIAAIALVTIGYASSSTVKVGDTIQVNYTGSFTNGTVFGSSAQSGPFNFTVGANQVIPGFDSAVVGMKVGEEKTVTIPANEAYGEINPALFISVPRYLFGNQSVYVGEQVTGTSTGRHGVITAVNSTNATIDFNSPLAGKTLVFNITVTKIVKVG